MAYTKADIGKSAPVHVPRQRLNYEPLSTIRGEEVNCSHCGGDRLNKGTGVIQAAVEDRFRPNCITYEQTECPRCKGEGTIWIETYSQNWRA